MESLRRLHLAAQCIDTRFWLVRPAACAAEPSLAVLHLGLRPASGGVAVDVLKRRSPQCDTELFITLGDMPDRRSDLQGHGPPVQHIPAAVAA